MNAIPEEIIETHSTNFQVGWLVKKALDARGWTQTRLSRELGIAQPNITDRLRGRTPFRADELIQIGEFLDIDPGDFLKPPEELFPQEWALFNSKTKYPKWWAAGESNPEPAGYRSHGQGLKSQWPGLKSRPKLEAIINQQQRALPPVATQSPLVTIVTE